MNGSVDDGSVNAGASTNASAGASADKQVLLSNQPPLLNVEQVTLQTGRGNHVLLRPLSLMVRPGERLAVVGHSGSGKTLLFRLLNGLLSPSQGEIRWQGQSISDMSGPELRRQVAWVSRSPRLLGMNTVKEAITYPLVLQSLSEKDIQQRLDQALFALAFPLDLLPQSASALNLVQQWWVTLARAWVMHPGLLLLELPLELSALSRMSVGNGAENAKDENAVWEAFWDEAALERAIATFQSQEGAVIFACRHYSAPLFNSAHQIFALSQGELHPITEPDRATVLERRLSTVEPSGGSWDEEDWGDD